MIATSKWKEPSVIRHLKLCVLVALVCTPAVVSRAEVRVYFSPNGGCESALANLAQSAHSYLDAACYSFTLDEIAGELIAAHQRGVKVRVITDRVQDKNRSSQSAKLIAAGIPVETNAHSGLMHNKFLVADGVSVATGSFNWSQNAVKHNDENLVVFRDESKTAAVYAQRFDAMWNDTERFKRLSVQVSSGPGSASPPQAQTAPRIAKAAPAPPQAQGDTVYITKSGKKFHRAGCSYLSRSQIPISRADAIARGYSPCSRCNP